MNISRRDAITALGVAGLASAACSSPSSSDPAKSTDASDMNAIPRTESEASAGTIIYENPLATEADIEGFKLEGSAQIKIEDGRMTMENARPPEDGQAANFVFWCPNEFPGDIEVSWDFLALREPGLCVFFFGAHGIIDDEVVSVLDPRLAPRQGLYPQYIESDVHTLQVSYFRRRWPAEQRLHLANLRRAPGFELLTSAADPLPSADKMTSPYRMTVRRKDGRLLFKIDDLIVLDWTAESDFRLPPKGNIGFRQMAPLKAAYSNLVVRAL